MRRIPRIWSWDANGFRYRRDPQFLSCGPIDSCRTTRRRHRHLFSCRILFPVSPNPRTAQHEDLIAASETGNPHRRPAAVSGDRGSYCTTRDTRATSMLHHEIAKKHSPHLDTARDSPSYLTQASCPPANTATRVTRRRRESFVSWRAKNTHKSHSRPVLSNLPSLSSSHHSHQHSSALSSSPVIESGTPPFLRLLLVSPFSQLLQHLLHHHINSDIPSSSTTPPR